MKTMSIKVSMEENELIEQASTLLRRKGTERLGTMDWDGTKGGTVGVAMCVLINKLKDGRVKPRQ